MFLYKDYQTVNLSNKRFYSLDDELYLPSITTILGTTMPQEKKASLENWRNQFGHLKADKHTKAATDK